MSFCGIDVSKDKHDCHLIPMAKFFVTIFLFLILRKAFYLSVRSYPIALITSRIIQKQGLNIPATIAKKKKQGKHHYVAISHGLKKMVRVIFSVLKSNAPFTERF